MRGSGVGCCCCFRRSGDDAERAQQGKEEEEALTKMFDEVTPPLAEAESRLPEEDVAACLSRA